jgi:hypothetical protein
MNKHYQQQQQRQPVASPTPSVLTTAPDPTTKVVAVILQVPLHLPTAGGSTQDYQRFLANKRLPSGSVVVDHLGVLYEIPESNIAGLVLG